ncbi:MAG: right-handed parallel beta-helix repeat-containing protein [Candidatus Delongbacteria bacterium]|nr:right-handed parallel beta-helix repeat-containing protein [Candidatus Delongbacteria bacterium]
MVKESNVIGPGTHIITENITVAEGDTLIIEPGARLEFGYEIGMTVNGVLLAVGEKFNPITFTSQSGVKRGGIKISGSSTGKNMLSNCILENSKRGGLYLYSCTAELTDCVIRNNAEYTSGGAGIYIRGEGWWNAYVDVTVTDCIIENNYSPEGYGGVGISSVEGNVYFDGCTIRNNSSDLYGGAVRISSAEDVVIRNSSVHTNPQDGISVSSAEKTKIENCIIYGNNDYGISGRAKVINCVIVNNGNGGVVGADCYNSYISGNPIGLNSGTAYCCNVYNNTSNFTNCNEYMGIPVTVNNNGDPCDSWNNISMDPKFTDEANLDFILLSDSPCIDSGLSSVPDHTYCEFDISGNTRVMDGNGDHVALIDIGTYEFEYIFPGLAGSGTESDPYQISNLYELEWIAIDSTRWDKHYIQTADIDATDTQNWNNGKGWDPIGNSSVSFTGSYNGQFFSIINLYICRGSDSYIGFFGNSSSADFKNIVMVNADITGYMNVGCITGKNWYSDIENCFSTGSVTGTTCVGGIVGENSSATIRNCGSHCSVVSSLGAGGIAGTNVNEAYIYDSYSTGHVLGYDDGGGLVGMMHTSHIYNCYSKSLVTGSYDSGGLVGSEFDPDDMKNYAHGIIQAGNKEFSTVSASFWDFETSGQTTSAGGTGLTTAEMQTLSTYTNAGWDFVGETANGTEEIWAIDMTFNDGYPCFSRQFSGVTAPAGSGTVFDPYRISSVENLLWITGSTERWDKNYIQTEDISVYAFMKGDGWSPIGNSTYQFTGSYDGQGYSISGLYISRPEEGHQGFFGDVYGADIKNFNLNSVNIEGNITVGGLIAQCDSSTVTNCHVYGSLKGYKNIGGLIGVVYNNSTITDCSSSCFVEGYQIIGGLSGYNTTYSTISDCYSTGTVAATDNYAGGLVGINSNTSLISESYSTGSVYGNDYIGGVVGKNNTSSIELSYSTSAVSGNWYIGGIAGNNYSGSVRDCYTRGSSTGARYTAGIIGLNNESAVVRNSYAASEVTGTEYYNGGAVGLNEATVENALFDSEVSGYGSSQGCIARTTAQMKEIATYTSKSWDFVGETVNGTNDYWDINIFENDGYPFLAWPTDLEAPGNVTVSASGSDMIIGWDANPQATSYTVYSSADPYAEFPSGWTLEASMTGTSWTDTNATGAKKFYVIVAASGKVNEVKKIKLSREVLK